PTYLAYNAATRTLSTDPDEPPAVAEMSELTLTYTVRDSARPPREVEQSFPLALSPPPIFSEAAPAEMTLTINTELRVELPALTRGFAPYDYALDGELPDGLAFDGETRMLTGTPTMAEIKSLTYRALDLLGARGLESGEVRAFLDLSVDTALPQAVEDLAARAADRRLRLSWSALQRADLANYRVRWSVGRDTTDWDGSGGSGENGVSTGTLEASYVLRNLTNNTVYSVQVAAENHLGAGEWSATLNADPRERLAFAATQEDLVFALNVPIRPRVTLPAAEHGEGDVAYTITADTAGISGLTFDAATREMHGTLTDAGGGSLVFPLEIATTYTATDSAATPVTDQLEFTMRVVTFDLDLDAAAGDATAAATAQDGIITARYLLGVRGAALLQGQSGGDVAAHEATLKDGVDSNALDVDGDGDSDGDDGVLLARYLLGLRGDELFTGFITDSDERAAAVVHMEALR
ncbi:MAG: fibronectin type III domain-containing protein, partial [Alphaproteobacteria bacterium]|nr:fibronectin type III domain-containing protein [Alphaproteobacteria bacterium]